MKSFFTSYKSALEFIGNIARQNKAVIIKYSSAIALTAGIQSLLPFIIKIETDQLVEKNTEFFWYIFQSPFMTFVCIASIVILIRFVENIIRQAGYYLKWIYTTTFEENYLLSIIKRLNQVQMGMYLNKRNQKFINSFQSGNFINQIEQLVINGILTHVIHLAGIIFAFSYLDIRLLLIVIWSVMVSFLLDTLQRKISKKHDMYARYTYENELREMKYLLTSDFDKIKISWWYDAAIAKFSRLTNDKIAFEKQNSYKGIIISLFSSFNINLSEFLIKLFVWYSILQWTQSIGLMAMVMIYIEQIRSFFQTIFQSKRTREDIIDELQRLQLYLTMTTPKTIKTQELSKNIETITVTDLSFSYPTITPEELKAYGIMIKRLEAYGEQNLNEWIKDRIHFIQDAFEEAKRTPPIILKDLNVSFQKWKIYGIVGHNWAWKTTLITLLMNYFDQYSWTISYNAKDISNVNPAHFDTLFGVITQSPFIMYSFSIRENLMIGVHTAYTDQQLYDYLDILGLKEKIQKLRKWLDSNIGYDGNFSWGEMQLLALLRVVLQDRPVLIIDEWTNQLDAMNEKKVMDILLKNRSEKITIFITHRMTTIKKADQILCLEDGIITDIGKHQELLDHGSNIYATFWNNQVG